MILLGLAVLWVIGFAITVRVLDRVNPNVYVKHWDGFECGLAFAFWPVIAGFLVLTGLGFLTAWLTKLVIGIEGPFDWIEKRNARRAHKVELEEYNADVKLEKLLEEQDRELIRKIEEPVNHTYDVDEVNRQLR